MGAEQSSPSARREIDWAKVLQRRAEKLSHLIRGRLLEQVSNHSG
jgi:hypothetical protein